MSITKQLLFFISAIFFCNVIYAAAGDTVRCDSSFKVESSCRWNYEESGDKTFIPHFDQVQPVLFSFYVYDRWGRNVFSTKSLSQGWNGRKNNRDAVLHDGTYYWIIYYKLKDELVTYTCKGAVECSGFDFLPPVNLQDTVQCDSIYTIPNTFTPGDDGMNEYFSAHFFCPPYSYEMWIFDRWGNTIFYTNEYEKGWNGTQHQGKEDVPVVEGVYVYKIKWTFFAGDIKHKLTGQITVIR
jgi:gliding motility-associated-like protein